MSVETAADKKISEAKEHLSAAYKCLLEVLDEDCWGHNEFKEEYMLQLGEVTFEILKLKHRL